jgi:hypothetical protein
MNISVHIERLILDGLSITHAQRSQLKVEIEAELASLLSSGGLSVDLQTHGAWPRIIGGTVQLEGEDEPGQLGKRIAQAVYRGIGQ